MTQRESAGTRTLSSQCLDQFGQIDQGCLSFLLLWEHWHWDSPLFKVIIIKKFKPHLHHWVKSQISWMTSSNCVENQVWTSLIRNCWFRLGLKFKRAALYLHSFYIYLDVVYLIAMFCVVCLTAVGIPPGHYKIPFNRANYSQFVKLCS